MQKPKTYQEGVETYLVKADSPENVSLVVMPQAGLVLLAVLAVSAGPASILGGHVAVVLPRVAEVLKGGICN
jgi:hypothetical protein